MSRAPDPDATLPMVPVISDYAPGLDRALDLIPVEDSYRLTGVDGTLPDWLRGTYLLNGPARFVRGEARHTHWLDGDGMVSALTFDAQGVRFANRFVQSLKLQGEEESGSFRYRTFGTAFDGDELLHGVGLASPVNVSVYPFAGKLLAFGEQGLPWELDPETLETLGEHTFGRRLNPISPFSAHPNFDPRSGEMLCFGVSFAANRPTVTLYRFDAAGELLLRRRQPLPYACTIHDFGLSERYAILHVAPYVLDMEEMLQQGGSVLDALTWMPERGSVLMILDRETGDHVATVPVGKGYCLHQINAFELPDQRLVVDLIEMSEPVYKDYQPLPDLFWDVAPAQPIRFVVDLEQSRLVERKAIAYRKSGDFPTLHPELAGRPYDKFWMLGISATGRPGRKFFDQLVAADWNEPERVVLYQCPEQRFLAGEPVFVPRPDGGEGEGVLIVPELDTRNDGCATSFLLFDAGRIENGPNVRLPLAHPLQPAFHAVFEPTSST